MTSLRNGVEGVEFPVLGKRNQKRVIVLFFTIQILHSSWAIIRGGLAVELGPGRFDSEGGRNYAREKFGGHSLGKFFVDTPPGLA